MTEFIGNLLDLPNRVRRGDFVLRLSEGISRGRTGRRVGKQRNCVFLATGENSLVQAAALIGLWKDGFVEATT